MRTISLAVSILGVLVLKYSSAATVEENPPQTMTVAAIAEQMVRMDRWRHSALQNYTVTRRYALENKRFHKHAEMTVRMTYTYPGRKKFRIVSESGSSWVRKHVLMKLIESELESSQDDARSSTKITPDNYEFHLVGTDTDQGRPCYVIEVEPKTENKFFIRGRVWIDTQDFAITKIGGSPAKSPSFWTRHIEIVQRYTKAGPFWLPLSNYSRTDVRIFGSTELKIDYLDYRINQSQKAAKAVSKPGEAGE